jgi:hypothetical protein
MRKATRRFVPDGGLDTIGLNTISQFHATRATQPPTRKFIRLRAPQPCLRKPGACFETTPGSVFWEKAGWLGAESPQYDSLG